MSWGKFKNLGYLLLPEGRAVKLGRRSSPPPRLGNQGFNSIAYALELL